MDHETINAIKSHYKQKYVTTVENHRKEKSGLKRTIKRKEKLFTALDIVQTAAQEAQNRIHGRINYLVTKCLNAIFDDPYEFEIQFVRKRGKTEAEIILRKKGLELKPKDGIGGGVMDIISFALRLACVSLQNPKPRKLLVLDEPFKMLSNRNDYRNRARVLLETLAEELDFQFIMVTHDPALETGSIVVID